MSWYEKYMLNYATIRTIRKLDAAEKLESEKAEHGSVDDWVAERLEKYGY